MEKLALVEHKYVIEREIQGLREMAKCQAVWGPKEGRSTERLDRPATEVSNATSSAADLLAAE